MLKNGWSQSSFKSIDTFLFEVHGFLTKTFDYGFPYVMAMYICIPIIVSLTKVLRI